MWFEKILKKLRGNSICDKCGALSNGNLLCELCQEYFDSIERKKKEEIKVKEELRRKSWIVQRDAFLKEENGR